MVRARRQQQSNVMKYLEEEGVKFSQEIAIALNGSVEKVKEWCQGDECNSFSPSKIQELFWKATRQDQPEILA